MLVAAGMPTNSGVLRSASSCGHGFRQGRECKCSGLGCGSPPLAIDWASRGYCVDGDELGGRPFTTLPGDIRAICLFVVGFTTARVGQALDHNVAIQPTARIGIRYACSIHRNAAATGGWSPYAAFEGGFTMCIRYFALVMAAATLGQAGCAIGFRGQAGRPVSPPVMVAPPDAACGQQDPAATQNIAPRIQPVAPR